MRDPIIDQPTPSGCLGWFIASLVMVLLLTVLAILGVQLRH